MMKAKNGLWVLGLFTIAGVVTVSCGGTDSGDDDDDTGTAGTTSTAGTSSTSAGTTSKAGTTGSSAGTTNTGGSATNNGGTGTGGRNTNNGGAPDFPGFGGAFEVAACPSGTKTGGACTPTQGAQNACQLNDTTYCGCQNDSTWLCIDTGDLGGGGQGPTFGQATCPANAMTGDDCTGLGICTGQNTCVCYMSSVTCR